MLFALFCFLLCVVRCFRIEGTVAAVFTPMKGDFSVNFDGILPYAKFLKKTGVDWVFVTGTTGNKDNKFNN